MRVGVLLKFKDYLYLAVNNPKYIASDNSNVATYDYIYEDVHNIDCLEQLASHAIGDQTGYVVSEKRLKSSTKFFSPFENVHMFIVELEEEEGYVVDNVADIMYSDYRTMPKTVPLVTLEKIDLEDLSDYLKLDTFTLGERSLKCRDSATLSLALKYFSPQVCS